MDTVRRRQLCVYVAVFDGIAHLFQLYRGARRSERNGCRCVLGIHGVSSYYNSCGVGSRFRHACRLPRIQETYFLRFRNDRYHWLRSNVRPDALDCVCGGVCACQSGVFGQSHFLRLDAHRRHRSFQDGQSVFSGIRMGLYRKLYSFYRQRGSDKLYSVGNHRFDAHCVVSQRCLVVCHDNASDEKIPSVHYIERQPHAIRTAFKRLFGVIAEKHRGKKAILLYLVAFFLYIDGVYTIIDMATSFGTALGFDTTQLLLALLVTQFVAFPSAILFGVLASKVRNDRLIFVCIIAYTAIAVFAIQMDKVWEFWLLAVCVGMFQGGIQALSRSYFAKIIPPEKSGEYFGIMDIFGKGAAFIGTLSVSIVTQLTNSVNMGVIPIACLFIAGLVVFVFASKEVRRLEQSEGESQQEVQSSADVQ